jgi:RecB family endonuclease NucS
VNDELHKLRDALNKNCSVIIVADCEISYSGRAESFLPSGGRIILIKPDGTLLVHQPSGSAPINYMKEASHILTFDNNELMLRSQNLPLNEFLDIKINKLHFFHALALEDGQKIQLQGTEKDMADMIMQNPWLIEKNFRPVSQEEQTKYGFIDVLGHDKSGTLVVVECKRYNGDLSAVTQLRRYVEKLKESKGTENIRGVLACPKITPNAHKMLKDWGFKFVKINPPKYLEKFDKKQKKLGEF